jgi:uncharacterized membrane protein
MNAARLASVLAALSLIGVTPAAASGSAAHAASSKCTYDTPAVINGEHKCLGPGEYCARRDERQYERYGFECSLRYDPPRLRRR